MEILYKGSKIDNLSITKIAIWNAGKETINNTDVAENDRFRIEINDKYLILESEIIVAINRANSFTLIRKTDNVLEIKFDYFDHKEGIIIQLYHTATSSEHLKIKGSFKGTKSIVRNDSSNQFNPIIVKMFDSVLLKPKIIRDFFKIMVFIIPIVMWIIMLGNISKFSQQPIFLIIISIILLLFTILYWSMGISLSKRRVPRGFKAFEDEF